MIRIMCLLMGGLLLVSSSGCVSTGGPPEDPDARVPVRAALDLGVSIPGEGHVIKDSRPVFSWALSTSYRINPHVGIDGMLSSVGAKEKDSDIVVAGIFGDMRQDTRVQSLTLGGRAVLPFGHPSEQGESPFEWFVQAGLGICRTEVEVAFPRGEGGRSKTDTSDDLGVYAGTGFLFRVADAVRLGLVYRYHVVYFRPPSDFLGEGRHEAIVFWDSGGDKDDDMTYSQVGLDLIYQF